MPTTIIPLLDDDERVIPFLRRLFEMLQENEEILSFEPGSVEPSSRKLGRIVVHDRKRVEKEVLPRYFNHSSFASLRRQLNYFAFVRLGKGRQKGATYFNEDVVVLEDILRLKRKHVVSPSSEDLNHGDDASEIGAPEKPLVETVPNPKQSTAASKPRNQCSTPKLQLRTPSIKFTENDPIVPVIHHSDTYEETTPKSKKRKFSSVNRALHVPRMISTPVSPSESGDERENSVAMISRGSSNSSLCFPQQQATSYTAPTACSISSLLQPLPFTSETMGGFPLQSEELLVCAALVNLGQLSQMQVATGRQS